MTCGKAAFPPSRRDRHHRYQAASFFLFCFLTERERPRHPSPWPENRCRGTRSTCRFCSCLPPCERVCAARALCRFMFSPPVDVVCPHNTQRKTSFEERRGELKVCEGLGSRLLLPRRAATAFKDLPFSPAIFFLLLLFVQPSPSLTSPSRRHHHHLASIFFPFCTTSRHLPSRVLWPALYIVIHK